MERLIWLWMNQRPSSTATERMTWIWRSLARLGLAGTSEKTRTGYVPVTVWPADVTRIFAVNVVVEAWFGYVNRVDRL